MKAAVDAALWESPGSHAAGRLSFPHLDHRKCRKQERVPRRLQCRARRFAAWPADFVSQTAQPLRRNS